MKLSLRFNFEREILKDESIICFGGNIFSDSRVSLPHVMEMFFRNGNRILWVNPLPLRFPSVKKSKKVFLKQITNKLKIHIIPIRRRERDFYILSLFYVPVFMNDFFDRLNDILIFAQIKMMQKILNFNSPIIWASTYDALPILDKLKEKLFIYHLPDKCSAFRELSYRPLKKVKLEEKEKTLIRYADLVFGSSYINYEYILQIANDKDKVRYFPHSVNFEHFVKASENTLPLPKDIRNIKHPIIGYFGSLTDDNDKGTIEYCATKRPNWSFILIGKVMGDYSRIDKLKNVYFLGPRPYKFIPNYGQCFDVCIMNWIPHEWITYSFPIKTLEYLAMGKPVVSVRIAEVERFYSDIISIADSKEEYLEKIEYELRNDSEEKKKRRIERVRGNTWEKRVEDISKIIEQKIKDNK